MRILHKLFNYTASKTTPVDADSILIKDSAGSSVVKQTTWANVKATLKSYFDTLYPSGSGTSSGTNTGDQTSIVGITGTKSQFDTACTDGDFAYQSDLTSKLSKNVVPWSQQIACSDLTTALTTGTSKAYFRVPYGVTLTGVRASLLTAQTSGSIFTVDINESGSTILSTKITIDNTEKTSVTASTAPVISDSSLLDDSEITIDIDQVGDGTAKGLIVTLIGTISV